MTTSKTVVGDTSFNGTDRLAVINLLYSYGYFFNEIKLEEFLALFAKSASIELGQGNNKTIMNLSQWRDYISNIQQFSRQQQIQPRHVLSTPRFDSQTSDQASGQIYLQLFTTQYNTTSLLTTGVYEFTAVKQANEWKLNHWVVKLDSTLGGAMPKSGIDLLTY
ncbi:nuclear transport factor 2 family protein [Limnoraphis robusta]|uniref:nuclear transport factor 2 family protein n=1 Tax=Limnoraphis robusta TaxID=1118279 RepID=UPI001F304501|nr:nuclear transport factor 2 family protein [Limnoraphis robusta]